MDMIKKAKVSRVQKIIGRVLMYGAIVDGMLFHGCKTGNVELVKKALALGADVNATRRLGKYSGGIGGRGNPSWAGTVSMTPLGYAAVHAYGKTDDKPYKDIVRLLAEKGADANRIVCGREDYWENDELEIGGFEPDEREKYKYSLKQVLLFRAKKKKIHLHDNPYDYCAISDSMATYMAGLFSLPSIKGLPSRLESKEAFLNDVTEKQRKNREKDVFTADVILREPLRADEVMQLRNAEEKERLKANKLRMKLERQRQPE